MELQEITPALLRKHPLPPPASDGDKNDHGRVLIVAGSAEIPGAALLSADAALRAGAGKVTMAVPRAAMIGSGLAIPETRVISAEGRIDRKMLDYRDAVLVGPGMETQAAIRWRAAALKCDAVVVLDAAAMPGVQRQTRAKATILTPHAGEMAALTGRPAAEIKRDPIAAARRTARELGVIVVLKGATTVIASPGGALFRHYAEIPGLGSSGSGDVLAGVIVGLAAQGMPAIDACLWGVVLHAGAGRVRARRMGTTGYLSRELAGEVPALMERARRRPS